MIKTVYVVSIADSDVVRTNGFNHVWDVWVVTDSFETAKSMIVATVKHSDWFSGFDRIEYPNGAIWFEAKDTQYIDHKPKYRTFRIQEIEVLE